MNKPILVIEDDQEVRSALRMVLESNGLKVIEASNGKEAIEKLRSGISPSLILLDIMMPIMDGWDFLSHKATEPNLAWAPVIVCSAADRNHPLAHLAVEFLPKPMNIDRLLRTIETYRKDS